MRTYIPAVAKRDRTENNDQAVFGRGVTIARELTLEAVMVDGVRSYVATLSSESPVRQWYGTEILRHTPEAVNLERAVDGLPLMFNHDVNQTIGRALGIKLEGGKLRATEFVFSQRAEAQAIRQDVEDGILREMSIRYSIDDYTETRGPDGEIIIDVVRWTPSEVSFAPVPADHSVGVGRAYQPAVAMRNGTGGGGDTIDLVAWRRDNQLAATAERQAGTTEERARVTEITQAFGLVRNQTAELNRLRDTVIERGLSVAAAQRALLAYINDSTGLGDAGGVDGAGAIDARVGDDERRGADARVSAGVDAVDKLRAGAERAVGFRAGLLEPALVADPGKRREVVREMRENPFSGLTLRELAREMLRARGLSANGDPHQVIGWALAPWTHPEGRRAFVAGMGTSDLSYVLENNANKALLLGWDEANETWPMIVRIGSLADYKAGTRTGIGGLGSLQSVNQNGEYQYAYVTDVKEPIQLGRKGVLVPFTREAIINDDLDALTRMPRLCGRAANRAIGDQVYALLTANAALTQDSVALFHATHANIASSGAPSVARLDQGDALMAVQKSPGSNESGGLNTELSRLIVPRALKSTARTLRAAQYDPAGSAGTLPPNHWQNNFEVVSDARLDATSTTVYYGSADPNVSDTIEVAFLNGNQEPFLDSQEGWKSDGIEWKVRHEFGSAVLDYRGLVRFPG